MDRRKEKLLSNVIAGQALDVKDAFAELLTERDRLQRLLADVHHGLYPYEGVISDEQIAGIDLTALPAKVAAVNAELTTLHAVVEGACEELDDITERSGWGSIGVVVERLLAALDGSPEVTDG